MPENEWNEWQLSGHQQPLNEKELARLSSTASRLGITPWELSIFGSIWYDYGQVDSKELLAERAFGSSRKKNPQKAAAAIDRVFDQGWVQFLSIEFLNEIRTELKEGGYLTPQGLIGYDNEIADTPESCVGIISFTRSGAALYLDWLNTIYSDNRIEKNNCALESHDEDWSSAYGVNLNACLNGIPCMPFWESPIIEMEAPQKIGRWCNRWWLRFESGYRIRFKQAPESYE